MDLEAKGFLSDYTQPIIKDAIGCVMQDYDDIPGEIKFMLAVERAEGKLDGMYTMFTVMKEKERADDAKEELANMIGQHNSMILKAFDVDTDQI